MIEKNYLSALNYQLDSFKLAKIILSSGWNPDVMLALWRGGAPVGVIVHEFLHYHGLRPQHHILKCYSYTGIKTRNTEVVFEDANEIFNSLTPGAKVLVVDDVFDTGHTARAIVEKLTSLNLDVRFASVYWKPGQNQTSMRPDFFVSETEKWVVFPHELEGLEPEEVRDKHPEIYNLLDLKRLAHNRIRTTTR